MTMLPPTVQELLRSDAPSYAIADAIEENRGGPWSDMATVYVLYGSTHGIYEPDHEWYVGAYLSKDAAERLCEQLNAWCVEHGYDPKGKRRRNIMSDPCPLDPGFTHSDSGTVYYVHEIPLRG